MKRVTYVPRAERISVYVEDTFIGSADDLEEAREMAAAYQKHPWGVADDPPDWFLVVYLALLAASAGAITYGVLSWL